jgi:hypothetical protein
MRVHVERFEAEDLEEMAAVYNQLADRDDVSEQWQAWGREIASALRLELASRRIAQAEHEDPLGFCWFGRL